MSTLNALVLNCTLKPAPTASSSEVLGHELLDALGTAALGLACAEVWLKLEHLQVAGSFKARGMYNRLLTNDIPASGVIVASLSTGRAGLVASQAIRSATVAGSRLSLGSLLGGVVGAQYGAVLATRLKPDLLRLALAVVILLVALRMAIGLAWQPDEIYSIEYL